MFPGKRHTIKHLGFQPVRLCAKRSVVPMSSPNDLHFPLQIGVKWRDAATTFASFCSPRSPNRTGFGMGRLKPRPTFSPHSSRYGTSSRRASVARAHVVSFSFCNFRCSRFARWRSSSSFGRNRNLSRDPRSVITLPQLYLLKQWQVFSGEWQRKRCHGSTAISYVASPAVSSSLIWSRRLFLGGLRLRVVLLLHFS